MAADPQGDLAALERLARWAVRWSPLTEVEDNDGLRLDITGVAHLFGGEHGLLDDMGKAFAAIGLTHRLAIAPTPGAAWALSRYGPDDKSVCGRDEIAARMAPLPVAALRLSPVAVRTLQRLGLKTIATLSGIERRSLARRFRESDNPVDALDRALGRRAEPLTAVALDVPPRATIRLAEPVTHAEAATQALGRLVPELAKQLQRRKLGARSLSLAGFRVDGSVGSVAVSTSIPSREPAHLERLLADKAANLDPGFGFDAFLLEASWSEPLGAAQQSLVEDPGDAGDIARLIDRLSVKLGPGRVRRPEPRQSHVPERASGWRSAIAGPASPGPALASSAQRPQRLFDRPEAIAVLYATPEGLPRRFVWRKAVHDIVRVEGPERIGPEWWRERSTVRARDYYRVEDKAGRRFWIFREGWIGDSRGGIPNWFLHGLFG